MATSKDPEEDYKLLGDVPVGEAGRDEDRLAFESTATVLARAAVETRNPLTIGVFGEWGTGKTSLMRLMKAVVERDKKRCAAAVWFNAWQYEKEEHLIVPLVATIIKELERCEKRHKWSAGVKKGARNLRDALRAVAYGISVKGKIGIPLISEGEVSLSAKEMFDRYQELTKDTVLARSLYFDAFEELSGFAGEEGGKREVPRVVVFVDDLDRCFPDSAVELLEHIKLVLHQPGFSFVLGVNDKIIQQFITTKFKKDYDIDIEESYFEDYLEKIVQVKVSVPKRKPDEMDEYIGDLLDEARVLPSDLKKDLIPLIAEAGKRNPRAIVRLLNRIIVNKRVGDLDGKDYDPLAQLIHEATDELRYEAFLNALDVTVILEEDKKKVTIGEYLAGRLSGYTGIYREWIAEVSKTRIISLESEFKKAIKTLEDNEHLYNLLKSEAGQKWLSNRQFRDMLGEASEPAKEERREETRRDLEGVIRDLLDNMVSVPAGEFKMGSKESKSETPIHTVRMDGFEIGALPVTQAQYEAIMRENPSRFKGLDNPVEMVSWDKAMEFCAELSKKTGREFALPSESQWEYACRAGSDKRYFFGDEEDKLGEYAWHSDNSGGGTHPVGRKRPNDWGLYDTHGNVWEWCLDRYHRSYEDAPEDGSAWEQGEGMERVVRGGGWSFPPESCRSAFRGADPHDSRLDDLGFRVVAVPAVEVEAEAEGGV
jgi:formylglycine-generating enzyme required for sulfatase activity